MRKIGSGQSLLGLSALGLACVLWTTAAFGLGLGGIEYKSFLGQQLNASIQIVGNDRGLDTESIRVRAVSEADAREMGVDLMMSPYGIKLEPELLDGGLALKLRSDEVIVEPFIDLLVELQWSGGLIYRQYTLLLDPPPKASRVVKQQAADKPSRSALAPRVKASASKPSTSARLDVAAGGTYRVNPGDSLSLIAERWRKGKGVTLSDTSQWILSNNPRAFIGGNAHRLVAGATLQLPELNGRSLPVPVTGTPEYTSVDTGSQQAPSEPQSQVAPRQPVNSGGKVYLGNSDAAQAENPNAQTRNIQTQVESAREMNDLLARENTELRKRIERIENSGYNETFEQIVNLQQQQIDELRRQLQETLAASSTETGPAVPVQDNQDLAQLKATAEKAAVERRSSTAPINPLWWVVLGLLVGAILSGMFVFLRRKRSDEALDSAVTYRAETESLDEPDINEGQFQGAEL